MSDPSIFCSSIFRKNTVI